jgi:uncharacterized protein
VKTIARNTLRSLCLVALAAGLAACGSSAPVRYYSLPAVAVAPAAAPLAGRSILVGPIDIPAYLDRPQIAIRGTDGEISFQEFQRWSEPLDAAFSRALVDDLIVLAGTGQAMAAPVPRDLAVDYHLRARVSRFDVDTAGHAVLLVQWYLADGAGKVLVAPRQDSYRRDAQAGAAAGATALGGTLADFAADVVRAIAALPAPARSPPG